VLPGWFGKPLAADRASRLRAAGYPAAVYDPRAFANLAWGELVVIAQGFAGPDARTQASRLATAPVRARGPARDADADAKPCEPLSPPALPVRSAAEVAPLPRQPPIARSG
jgi:hypothetical protein